MIGIRVDAIAGRAPDQAQAAWFGHDGGDIGRGADCTLALADPERHISRRHASVHHRDGRYYLRPLSAGLPLLLDGRALQPGEEHALQAGQVIVLGLYTLQVLEEPDSLGLPTDAAAWRDSRRGSVDPLLQELKPSRPPPPPTGAAPPAVDLLVGETDAFAAAPPRAPTSPPPPPPPAPAPVATAPPPPTAVSAPGAGADPPPDPTAALLAGLGLPHLPAGGFGPEQWRTIGGLLRVMTEGTLELLTARMVAKRELGADATRLQQRENNPLKFSPDVDAALAHLLGPAERGFLSPLQAAREAFDDLRAHQVALLAGMRAALDSVMARFDPAALEQRIAPGGALESLIPGRRKARLWTEYSRQFAQIVGEVEGDFDALLGRAFLKAYQAQLAELARRDDAPDVTL